MANCIVHRRFVTLFSVVLLVGCGWVDGTGRQSNAQGISLDDVNTFSEDNPPTWPLSDFDPDENIQDLVFKLIAEGDEVSGCSSAAAYSSLHEACAPALSEQDCRVDFEIGASHVSVKLPQLWRALALRYQVQVLDEDGASDSRDIEICVSSVDETPSVENDEYTVPYLGALEHSGARFDDNCRSLGGTGVLENDSDDFDFSGGWLDGQGCLRVELLSEPTYASAFEIHEHGGFVYQSSAAAGPGTRDSFSYRVSDGVNLSAEAFATITITGENLAPIALKPVLSTSEDVALDILLEQLATDPENTALRLEGFVPPEHGTIELPVDVDGLRFIPQANFFGSADISLTIVDAAGEKVQSGARIEVAPVNDVPVVTGLPNSFDVIVADPQQPGEFQWSVVLGDVETTASELQLLFSVDEDIAELRFEGPSQTGEVELFIRPVRDGSALISIQVQDRVTASLAAQTVQLSSSLNISGMNLAPIAENDLAFLFKNGNRTVSVVGNDRDPDGLQSALRIESIVSQPANGSAAIVGGGLQLSYTPDIGFSGTDSVRYRIVDEDGAMAEAVLQLTVVNRVPVVQNESESMFNTESLNVSVLLNDVDPDGDELSLRVGEGDFHGQVLLITGVIIRYTPQRFFTGTVRIPYEVDDGDGGVSVGVLTIRVEEDNPH